MRVIYEPGLVLGFGPFQPDSSLITHPFFPHPKRTHPRTPPARTKPPPERRAAMFRRLLRRLSTTAESAVTASRSLSPSQPLHDGLYRRIADVGHPCLPLSPVLEQWAREGHTIEKHTIQAIVKKLVGLHRFAHALEVRGKSSTRLDPHPPPSIFFLYIPAHSPCTLRSLCKMIFFFCFLSAVVLDDGSEALPSDGR